MTIHEVKSWPWFFEAIVSGAKKHDIRGPDRDYKVGDELHLKEFDPRTGQYTGNSARAEITYITNNFTPCALSSAVLQNGYSILSLELI